jgi:hypothetical protein
VTRLVEHSEHKSAFPAVVAGGRERGREFGIEKPSSKAPHFANFGLGRRSSPVRPRFELRCLASTQGPRTANEGKRNGLRC